MPVPLQGLCGFLAALVGAPASEHLLQPFRFRTTLRIGDPGQERLSSRLQPLRNSIQNV
jgi:hypothetical protein